MPIDLKSSPLEEDVLIWLTGDLDEKIQFPNLKLRLSQRVIFDCEKLNHLSSFAAQRWSAWMREFDERQQFVLRNVPPRAVDLFNMIENFLPLESTVESFYIPYECDVCGYDEPQLARRGREFLEAQDEKVAILRLPHEINCPRCHNGMKMGVWESKFLRFLEKRS